MALPKIYITGIKVDGIVHKIGPLEIKSGSQTSLLMESRLAPAQPESDAHYNEGWISVDERLPENGEEVYTYNIKGGLRYHILYLDDDGIWRDENYVENAEYDNPPTHWHKIAKLSPLPSAPRPKIAVLNSEQGSEQLKGS